MWISRVDATRFGYEMIIANRFFYYIIHIDFSRSRCVQYSIRKTFYKFERNWKNDVILRYRKCIFSFLGVFKLIESVWLKFQHLYWNKSLIFRTQLFFLIVNTFAIYYISVHSTSTLTIQSVKNHIFYVRTLSTSRKIQLLYRKPNSNPSKPTIYTDAFQDEQIAFSILAVLAVVCVRSREYN